MLPHFTYRDVDATIRVMTTKTLKQLRELAKKAGVKGYSKLAKPDLEKKLSRQAASSAKAASTPPAAKSNPKAATKPPAPRKKTAPGAASTPRATMATRAPTPVDPNHVWWQPPAPATGDNGTEQRIESAKYGSGSSSDATAPPPPLTDLGEDIDRLPNLHRSTLVLLPQKPGVLHAYWSLPPGATREPSLQLRLCRAANGELDVQHEATVSAARGHFYFSVPDDFASHEAVVQLGYYRGKKFVSAIDRGVARIPSLYASARTDRWWWISEADFRRMYLSSGGEQRGRALRWAGSIGSPSGESQTKPEQLAWPGGVSSR